MKSLFDNITDDEYQTLDDILHNPGCTPSSFFFNDPTIDGRIKELVKYELITINNKAELNITELGRAALKEHDNAVRKARIHKLIEMLKFIIPTVISIVSLAVSIIALVNTMSGQQ